MEEICNKIYSKNAQFCITSLVFAKNGENLNEVQFRAFKQIAHFMKLIYAEVFIKAILRWEKAGQKVYFQPVFRKNNVMCSCYLTVFSSAHRTVFLSFVLLNISFKLTLDNLNVLSTE